MIYLYLMVDNPFDIAVLVVALIIALVAAIVRWPWWLPAIIAVLATFVTQEGGDINFWLIGFPAYAIVLYAVYGIARAIWVLRPNAQRWLSVSARGPLRPQGPSVQSQVSQLACGANLTLAAISSKRALRCPARTRHGPGPSWCSNRLDRPQKSPSTR